MQRVISPSHRVCSQAQVSFSSYRSLRFWVLLALALNACSDAPVTPSAPDAALLGSWVEVPANIAESGCAVGRALGPSVTRVRMVSRSDLPFRLPPMQRVRPLRDGRAGFLVKRVVVGPPDRALTVACLLPISHPLNASLASVIAQSPQTPEQLARLLDAMGTSVAEPVQVATGTALRSHVFPKARNRARESQSQSAEACCAQRLGTITVTASRTYAAVDLHSVGRLFAQYGEPYVDVDYWLEEQWQEDCDAFNRRWQEWADMQGQINPAASELADILDALIAEMEREVTELEQANYQCKPVPGLGICIDFFIPNCILGSQKAGMGGDCRDFDPEAEWSKSRVQAYLDPETFNRQVKFSSTKLFLNGGVIEVDDSANVYNHATDYRIDPLTGTEGGFQVRTSFKNNLCAHFSVLCPAIDASIQFYPDANRACGYRVEFQRDAFPSMGVYCQSGSEFIVMKEDAAKTRTLIGALRSLSGNLRSVSAPPPPENPPPGCYIE